MNNIIYIIEIICRIFDINIDISVFNDALNGLKNNSNRRRPRYNYRYIKSYLSDDFDNTVHESNMFLSMARKDMNSIYGVLAVVEDTIYRAHKLGVELHEAFRVVTDLEDIIKLMVNAKSNSSIAQAINWAIENDTRNTTGFNMRPESGLQLLDNPLYRMIMTDVQLPFANKLARGIDNDSDHVFEIIENLVNYIEISEETLSQVSASMRLVLSSFEWGTYDENITVIKTECDIAKASMKSDNFELGIEIASPVNLLFKELAYDKHICEIDIYTGILNSWTITSVIDNPELLEDVCYDIFNHSDLIGFYKDPESQWKNIHNFIPRDEVVKNNIAPWNIKYFSPKSYKFLTDLYAREDGFALSFKAKTELVKLACYFEKNEIVRVSNLLKDSCLSTTEFLLSIKLPDEADHLFGKTIINAIVKDWDDEQSYNFVTDPIITLIAKDWVESYRDKLNSKNLRKVVSGYDTTVFDIENFLKIYETSSIDEDYNLDNVLMKWRVIMESKASEKRLTPNVTVSVGEYTARLLDAKDRKALVLGKLTDCCQHVLGGAGSTCAWYGLENPDHSGFYVIEKNDKIFAQAWAWVSGSTLVFDNIEGLGDESRFAEIFTKLAEEIISNSEIIDKVKVGTGHATWVARHWAETNLMPVPFDDTKIYTDANETQCIISTRKGE